MPNCLRSALCWNKMSKGQNVRFTCDHEQMLLIGAFNLKITPGGTAAKWSPVLPLIVRLLPNKRICFSFPFCAAGSRKLHKLVYSMKSLDSFLNLEGCTPPPLSTLMDIINPCELQLKHYQTAKPDAVILTQGSPSTTSQDTTKAFTLGLLLELRPKALLSGSLTELEKNVI